VIGILSPTIVVFSAVGGYFIIKRSFRPIKKIYSTAASIKNEEDYTKRVPVDESKDEVHELAVMVNQMLDRVENSINREKRFSSNVSHELRTPLTVMLAQAEYMLDKAKDNKTKNEIETIISQINYMEKIVTQLLDITRAKRLSKEEMDQIDMYELIKFTKDTFAKYLEFKHITFNLIEPGFNTTIDANQTMMIRVFSNLISNAIKYNQENGSITIGFKKDDQQLVIDVDDTGKGISKDHLDKIFDPFYRADESRTQNDYSIGLGLSLVKEIIRQHNGSIQVKSTPLKGTRFTVSLPFKTK
ncbi:MAG TPA: HAMP domain-containing sensor histidine kinase, partial [Bacillota bacterium]|nr:HAMP domain-containing sensor histidine kinase [Bacillota bacterium]